jgi:uncharacterized protein (TIGR02284 family)
MTKTTIQALNELIETLKDGEMGFKTASEDAISPGLKRTLAEYANQRAQFSRTLQALVALLGRSEEEPTAVGSIGGTLHRGWINAKAAFSSRTDLSILEECERGEDSAVATFRKTLADANLGIARTTIEEQFVHLRVAHDHIRTLRAALTQAA